MASDDLEPGQQDLISEGSGKSIVGRLKQVHLTGLSPEESLYTDHNAGAPDQFTSKAEKDHRVERRSGSPIRSSVFQKMRAGVLRFGDLGHEARTSIRHSRTKKGLRGG